MGDGGEASRKNTSGSGLTLQWTDTFRLESRKQEPLFFPRGAAAPVLALRRVWNSLPGLIMRQEILAVAHGQREHQWYL